MTYKAWPIQSNSNVLDILRLLFFKKQHPEVYILRGFQIYWLIFSFSKMSVKFNIVWTLSSSWPFFFLLVLLMKFQVRQFFRLSWISGWIIDIPDRYDANLPSLNCVFSPTFVWLPFLSPGEEAISLPSQSLSKRDNYIGEAEYFFFLENFSYLGVSRCHCHPFLPCFRKEAFGAGNLLAPDPTLLNSVKTGIMLAAEEQTVGSASSKNRT